MTSTTPSPCHRHLLRTAAAVLGMACVFNAQSAVSTCMYKVTKVSMSPAGWVWATFVPASGSGVLDYVQLCNVDTAVADIPASSCKAMLATLLTAKTSQANVMMWFDQPTAFSCNATLSWANLRNAAGWYFGPSIE